MGGRERRVSLPCDVGHPYSGMEMPEGKAWEQGVCRDLGADRPPAYTGGWRSALLEVPASSFSGARSVLGPQWGFTTGCNLSPNFRPIWVSRPLQRGPHPTFSSSLPAPAYLTSLTCSHSPAVSPWSEFCFTFQVNHNCLVDSTDPSSGSQLPARRGEAMHG